MKRRRTASVAAITGLGLLMAACVETRVVHRKGMRVYSPRPTPETAQRPIEELLADLAPEGVEVDPATMRYTTPNTEVVLVALAPRHVILHLHTTITNQEYDLLYDQVISEYVKSQYRSRGEDPQEAVDAIIDAREEVLALLQTVPSGEHSPSVRLSSRDGRLRLHSSLARLERWRFSTLEFIVEPQGMRLAGIFP
ncbi:MAG: hypothetical protein AAGI30_13305 [Planctomycetota bacterium]